MSTESSLLEESASDLDGHRRQIDRVDRTIVALLAERVRLGIRVGRLKRRLDQPARVPEREADVLDRVRAAAAGQLLPASVERIFTAIIAETRAAQEDGDGDA